MFLFTWFQLLPSCTQGWLQFSWNIHSTIAHIAFDDSAGQPWLRGRILQPIAKINALWPTYSIISQNGIMCELSVHMGKEGDQTETNLGGQGLTRKIVGHSHHIYCDNYISPSILKDDSTYYACGTFRRDCKVVPKTSKLLVSLCTRIWPSIHKTHLYYCSTLPSLSHTHKISYPALLCTCGMSRMDWARF